jgi:hypothetical protein
MRGNSKDVSLVHMAPRQQKISFEGRGIGTGGLKSVFD